MIVPGNIRERPRDWTRVALGSQILDELIVMITEVNDVESLAFSRWMTRNWEDVDVLQLKDRCAILRQELDIMKRLLKQPIEHEIHDSH